MSEDRTKELANIEKLDVAEITLQKARAQGSKIVYVRWLDDAARRTPEDLEPVRSGMDATQVSTNDREDVVQATLPTKASRIVLSLAATKPQQIDIVIGNEKSEAEAVTGEKHSYRSTVNEESNHTVGDDHHAR